VTDSKRVKWGVGSGCVARGGNRVIHVKVWLENLKGKDKRETPRICALHIRETSVTAIICRQGCTCLRWPFREATQITLGLR